MATGQGQVLPQNRAVCLNARGSSDADGQIVQVILNFGDGVGVAIGSTDITLCHVYSQPGNYQVSITVVDDDGARSSASGVVSLTQ